MVKSLMARTSDSDAQRQVTLNLAADELKQPLHTKVRQILREQILNGFQHGQRFYSERELIQNLKVSQPTVRRALSDLVAEGYLKPALRRGFFVQKVVPLRYVGLIYPAINKSQTSGPVETLSQACRDQNLSMNVYYVHKGEAIDSVFESIRHRPNEERIIMTGLTTEFTLQMGAKLQANGYSHLVIGPRVSGFTGGSLSFDHDNEVDQVLNHLIELGHKRIVFMVNEPRVLFITSQRAEAVKRKLAERHLSDSSLIYCDTKTWENSFEAALRKTEEIWTTSSPRPTAIIPLSGIGAWAVLQYAMTHGIQVPGELSIVSFDPVSNSDILPIPMSELTFSYIDRAEKAAQMLWSEGSTPLHDLVRTQLIPRASSGPALNVSTIVPAGG
jgi:DNA-binding LacI/PurR family transcriptional regulator